MSSEMSLEEANAEAVRRIHAAKAKGQTWLDLGDLPITRVPDEIVELKDTLWMLALGEDRLTAEGGQAKWDRIFTRPGWVADLGPLARLTALTALNISGARTSDLTPLSGLATLAWLDIANTSVRDLSPLSGLTALTCLQLFNTSVSDLTPLSGLTALKWLSAKRTEVSDLGPLARLSALGELHLTMTKVRDLEPLARLTTLTSLVVDLSLGVGLWVGCGLAHPNRRTGCRLPSPSTRSH
jgi:hypothetical protein